MFAFSKHKIGVCLGFIERQMPHGRLLGCRVFLRMQQVSVGWYAQVSLKSWGTGPVLDLAPYMHEAPNGLDFGAVVWPQGTVV